MKNKSVLLVDSCRWCLEMLSGYLTDLGFRVTAVASSIEAVEHARYLRPDLVMMEDPGNSDEHLESLRYLKNHPACSSVPVIVIGDFVLEEERDEALHAGADMYLSRPLNLSMLSRRLEFWLRRGAVSPLFGTESGQRLIA